MQNPLHEALIFIIKTGVDLFFFLILVRFLFQCCRVDLRTPRLQLMMRLTTPLVRPFQKICPTFKNVDLSLILVLFLLKGGELSLITLLKQGTIPHWLSLMVWPLGELLSQTINLLCLAIIFMVLLSWFSPRFYTPLTVILVQITDPLLSPIRRVIPVTPGIDYAPLIMLFMLKLTDILLANPILHWGKTLALQ